MNSFFIFITLLSISTSAQDIFLGSWKEDPLKRQNLNNFLFNRGRYSSPKKEFIFSITDLKKKKNGFFSGIDWFKRTVVCNSNSWFMKMTITKRGNVYTESGKRKYLIICNNSHKIIRAVP